MRSDRVAERHDVRNGVAAQAVGTMNATSHFTHGIQPRNRLSLGVQRFALHVNSDSTHRVMNRRDFLAGVPGAFCHRLIVCVIRNEPEAILLLPCNSIVVLLNGSLEVCRLHTGFFGRVHQESELQPPHREPPYRG